LGCCGCPWIHREDWRCGRKKTSGAVLAQAADNHPESIPFAQIRSVEGVSRMMEGLACHEKREYPTESLKFRLENDFSKGLVTMELAVVLNRRRFKKDTGNAERKKAAVGI